MRLVNSHQIIENDRGRFGRQIGDKSVDIIKRDVIKKRGKKDNGKK